MFKFLFGGKSSSPKVTIETDRTRYARLVGELNEMIDGMAVKPRVTIDPETGHVLPETPEQFADEALALPAPAPVEVPAEEDAPKPTDVENTTAEDAMPETPNHPTPPVPNPPKPRVPGGV